MASSPSSIERIDPNFQSIADTSYPIRWVDAFESESFALRGIGSVWLEENRPARSFRRLPDRAADPLSEGVQHLSRHPASAFLSFYSDSRSLHVRTTISQPDPMAHMPQTGSNGVELYLREGRRWLPVATGIPELSAVECERQLFTGLPKARREFRLYLPLYRELKELSLGFEEGALVEPSPAPAGQKPIFIYGTSITQGGCASTAGSDYVSLLGRLLEVEVINFGFSGNGRAEPEIAELIAEVDPELYVLDFAANCPIEMMRERLPRFVEILRERRPGTPIVLITQPQYNGILVSRERMDELGAKRDFMLGYYSQQRAAGHERLHLIDGFGIAPAGVTGTYVDGVHPTSAGFIQMAERIAPQLTAIRIQEREWR